MKETTWRISGMHCPHCETAILRAVRNMKGIENPRANYRAGTLSALWDDKVLAEAALRNIIAEAGYTLAGQREAMPIWKRPLSLLAVLAVLAALFAAAFLIRAAACSLPALQPRELLFFQDETGDPYLREMDSYFYLRHAEEMQASGEIAWSVRRGRIP